MPRNLLQIRVSTDPEERLSGMKLKYEIMGNSTASQRIWAFIFIIFGCVSFAGFLYAAVISKLLPPLVNPLLSAMQRDR